MTMAVMISGGPDGLFEALWRMERQRDVILLHCHPAFGSRHVYRQIEVLGRMGFQFRFETLFVPHGNGVTGNILLAAIPALVEFAAANHIDTVWSGGCEDDQNQTVNFHDLDRVTEQVFAVATGGRIRINPNPVLLPKSDIREWLGPLWAITHSCDHAYDHCGRCDKCHERARAEGKKAGPEPLSCDSLGKIASATTAWRGSPMFQDVNARLSSLLS